MAAPAELTGIRLVDIGLGNGIQEMEIGETVDGSLDTGEPTRRSTRHFHYKNDLRPTDDRLDGVTPTHARCSWCRFTRCACAVHLKIFMTSSKHDGQLSV